jgi:hypothetical protein
VIANPRSLTYWPRLETEAHSRVHHQAGGETTSEHRRMQEYGAQSTSRPARLGAAPVTSCSPSPRPFQCPKRLGKRTSNRRPSPICPHSATWRVALWFDVEIEKPAVHVRPCIAQSSKQGAHPLAISLCPRAPAPSPGHERGARTAVDASSAR